MEDALQLAVETTRMLLGDGSGCTQGRDSSGTVFDSVRDFWAEQLAKHEPVAVPAAPARLCWYSKAAAFWQDPARCAASEDGVLGGFGHISPVDVRESSRFLRELRCARPALGSRAALDCAAGIGRAAKHLLLPVFQRVDLLEQSERLLAASVDYVGAPQDAPQADGSGAGSVGLRLHCGMQQFDPGTLRLQYDVIWVQWAVGHLTDVDMVDFLQRCRAALRPSGVICLKENVIGLADSVAFEMDTEDSSLTRSLDYFRTIFRQSGLSVVRESQQDPGDWPTELLPVYMWALA